MSTAVTDLKDLPKIFNKPQAENYGRSPAVSALDEIKRAAEAENMAELMRLIREIHAAVCSAPEEQEKPKRRWKFRHIVLELMEAGKFYIAEDFAEPLTAKGIETTVAGINTALIKLAQEGAITRHRAGIYKLPDAATQTEE